MAEFERRNMKQKQILNIIKREKKQEQKKQSYIDRFSLGGNLAAGGAGGYAGQKLAGDELIGGVLPGGIAGFTAGGIGGAMLAGHAARKLYERRQRLKGKK